MPQINIPKETAAIVIGAVDEGLEAVDRSRGWTQPFRTLTDWGRLGAVLVSGFMWVSDMGTDYADAALYSSSALAVKSVSRLVRQGLGGTAGAFRRPGAQSATLTPQSVVAGRSLPAGRPATTMHAVEQGQTEQGETILVTTA